MEATLPISPEISEMSPEMSPEEIRDFDKFIISIISSFTNDGDLNLNKVLKYLGLKVSEGTLSYLECNDQIRSQINHILKKTEAVLKAEDPQHAGFATCGKVKIFSDLHGDFKSLLLILINLLNIDCDNKTISIEEDTTYLFLGDFINRGVNGLPILLIVFALKCRFPRQIVMIGGNHEDEEIAERLGFEREMHGRSMQEEYTFIMHQIFPLLRLFWILGNTMYVHGGITNQNKLYEMAGLTPDALSPDGFKVISRLSYNNSKHVEFEDKKLSEATKEATDTAEDADEGIVAINPDIYTHYQETQLDKNLETKKQFQWSDPIKGWDNYGIVDRDGFSRNRTRGIGKCFNRQAVEKFLEIPISSVDGTKTLQVEHVARGHSHGNEYTGYVFGAGHGGGNILFGGLVFVLWSVLWYGSKHNGSPREAGFGTKTQGELDEVSPCVKEVDRLTIGDYRYYAILSDIDFEKMGDNIQKIMSGSSEFSGMIKLWKLAELGKLLEPEDVPDEITPCPSRSNSNNA
jgi:hypothetical protein